MLTALQIVHGTVRDLHEHCTIIVRRGFSYYSRAPPKLFTTLKAYSKDQFWPT